MDNLRFTHYQENKAPILKGTKELTLEEPLTTTTLTLEYLENEDDAIEWSVLEEPSFGDITITDNKDGTQTILIL